jgi:hypothetical protein
MKYIIALLILFPFCGFSQELTYVQVYGSKIYFAPPDTSHWELVENSMDSSSHKYVLMFKSEPITDNLGRQIQPVLSILVEFIKDSSDIISYSIWKRTQVPFEVKKVMACDTINFSWFACPNVIGYEGVYPKGDVIHRVFVVHMRRAAVGVQIICDSTDGVYDKVEFAMRDFIRSVGIDQ